MLILVLLAAPPACLARLVLGTLCPSPAYMRWRYGRKPRGLGWLAYLQRAGLGVKAVLK